MNHVFGPVPSRRLGRSLGVDPVPLKTCNFSCVYCQLGRTRSLASKRRAFFNVSTILAEVAAALDHQRPDAIDWITFVGSGETTLFSRLGSLIQFVQSVSKVPVAVITNGSFLSLPAVRKELSAADAVLPSLDAGSEDLYRRINRPHPDFAFDQHVDGLIEFRKLYEGKLWVEVMLLDGVNDSRDGLLQIAEILERIEPDEVHLSTPTRPPAEPWVKPPDEESLSRASSILGGVARLLHEPALNLDSGAGEEISDAVLSIVSRHPMQEIELVNTLARWAPERVFEALGALSESGKIRIIERRGKRFWYAKRMMFSDLRTESA